ncbi:AAA domain protein [Enterobacter hormaechei subsp. xiangfangensis]|nr:AAA family ATPase [Enterobacter hormaechei]KHG48280.1 AAA domain protein [Enterobacter hormaechei subsp. xiangfangensis]
MKSYLRIEKLILAGLRKDYIVSFENGLNIIHGDSDTGKSSILEFINYLLGSSRIELADEVISSVKFAAMEVFINDSPFTIIRDIYKPSEFIEVYPSLYEEKDSFLPGKYAPNFKITNAPDGFFSDFLMDKLNFPKLKLKVSPTQEVSKFQRLSFRNIMKFAYVNQDDMGSKSLLNLTEWGRYTQTKEVFKYIYNLFDADIADIESQISEKKSEHARLVKKYDNVAEFLRETGYESISSLDDAITECDTLIEDIEESLEEINATMTADSENYNELKSLHNEFNLKIKGLNKKYIELSHKKDQYIRLKNDYLNDVKKIKAIHVANERIGSLADLKCNCPICDNIMSINTTDGGFINSKPEQLDEELKSLIKRTKSIEELIIGITAQQHDMLVSKNILEKDLIKVSEMIDSESREMITPFLTQRDTLIKEIVSTKKQRENLVSSLRVRNHQEEILVRQKTLIDNLEKLNEELDRLRSNAPSIDGVLSDLADNLNDFLAKINIKNRTGIDINKTHFSAIVRGKDYFNITSGGLRTIVSIGYMSSILKSSIKNDINHPRLLMLDTVGKCLGKNLKEKYVEFTDKKEDAIEGASDPLKYEKIYFNLIDICNYAEKNKTPIQIIVVDNDVPENLAEKLREITVAQYSSTGENGLPIGLIDDI